ncbi:hypothetical protein BDQ17DRAFT_1347680 [Cyathus striatus]|nr:hypothetical protein BDQ17DRAFT_1347680 [Cyathus striatus]
MNFPITVSLSKESEFLTTNLYPITSYETGRYEKAHIVERKNVVVEAGMFALANGPLPTYLPLQWTVHTHPEGDNYFYRSTALPVVTEVNLYDTELADKVSLWVDLIEQEMIAKQLVFSGRVELFLKIENDNCYYYFADHDSQTLFWMEDYDSERLELPQVVSSSHLKTALKERYWNHIQNFPQHLGGGLPMKVLDDLICVLNHAIADHMTSDASTFPYDERTCMRFVKLLNNSKDQLDNGYTIAYIARLWALIENYRYWVLHGQENAKLSRTQAVLIKEPLDLKWSQLLTSLLSWNESQRYSTRFNELYVDHYVYQTQWSKFMAVSFNSWKSSSMIAISLLLLHTLLMFVPFSRTLAAVSAGFLSISLLSSILLMHSHEELREGSASDAHEYLSTIFSEKYKFQWTAFIFSLPKACYFWGMLAFFSQWIVISNLFYGAVATACVIALLALIALGVRSTISGIDLSMVLTSCEEIDLFGARQEDVEKDSPV